MNSYLEAFKRLKDESMRDDLEDIMEDLLSIVAEDRGNNYVISSRRLSSIIGGMNMSNFGVKYSLIIGKHFGMNNYNGQLTGVGTVHRNSNLI